jgi:hypothetical protein
MDSLPTEFDCESILQMLRETPDAADAIIDMIADLEEVDEDCLRMARELQQSQATAAA